MRFVADECVSPVIVTWLRERGHDVLSIRETHRGAKDTFVLSLASRERRVVLTEATITAN